MIPLLAVVLAVRRRRRRTSFDWIGAAKALGVIVGADRRRARCLVRPAAALHRRAPRLREVFTGFALLLVVGIAALMQCGRPVDGARRLPRRRAARRQRIPPRARDRHRAVQGPAARACSSSRSACRSTSACSCARPLVDRSASSLGFVALKIACSICSRAALRLLRQRATRRCSRSRCRRAASSPSCCSARPARVLPPDDHGGAERGRSRSRC